MDRHTHDGASQESQGGAQRAAMAPPRKRRRWLSYSLRTVLLAATIVCIWLGSVVNRAHQQRRLVQDLRAAGARVQYEGALGTLRLRPAESAYRRRLRAWLGDDYFDDVAEVWAFGVDDALLGRIGQLRRLESLQADGRITDRGVASIARLRQLNTLSLGSQEITDAGVVRLAELQSLRNLYLTAPGVTDRGVASLARLGGLERLNLTHTQVTNRGLRSLTALRNLEQLQITEPWDRNERSARITDAGLVSLVRLPKLIELDLECDGISDAGLATLGAIRGLLSLDIACQHPAYTVQGVNDLRARLPLLSVKHSVWQPTWQPETVHAPPVFHAGP